jgi:hypothetical protein
MEYLGYTFDTPEMDRHTGNWKPVELTFDEQDNFNAATSKVLKLFKHPDGDGKCIVTDADGQKYMMDIVHTTFDIYTNSIKVFPTDCRKMK